MHPLAQVTHSLTRCKNPQPLEPQLSGKENLDSGCENESPTTSAGAKKQPSRSTKKRVVYFDKSESDLDKNDFSNDGRRTSHAVLCSLTSEKKPRAIAIIGEWSCDKCTYRHRYHAQICIMCNANRDDKVKDGEKPSYSTSSSSSSSAKSAITMTSKREWSLVDEKDYATKDVPNARIVTPMDLEEVSTMIDFICYCSISYAAN
jgi:hypothetical protein